jgi:hypothetical protein
VARSFDEPGELSRQTVSCRSPQSKVVHAFSEVQRNIWPLGILKLRHYAHSKAGQAVIQIAFSHLPSIRGVATMQWTAPRRFAMPVLVAAFVNGS